MSVWIQKIAAPATALCAAHGPPHTTRMGNQSDIDFHAVPQVHLGAGQGGRTGARRRAEARRPQASPDRRHRHSTVALLSGAGGRGVLRACVSDSALAGAAGRLISYLK
jgi:hypothetical protein